MNIRKENKTWQTLNEKRDCLANECVSKSSESRKATSSNYRREEREGEQVGDKTGAPISHPATIKSSAKWGAQPLNS